MPVLAATSALVTLTLPHLRLSDPSVSSLAAAVAASIGGVLAYLNRQRLGTIQINVNGRLTEALAENAKLREENKTLKAALRKARKAGR